MDAAGLIRVFRQRADDDKPETVSLWKDVDLLAWASEAECEACLRARLIWDDTSPFLTIPLVVGQDAYAINPIIDRIDRVVLTLAAGGRPRDLRLTGVDDIAKSQGCGPDNGRPQSVARIGSSLRLWPTPSTAGEIRIECYRLPVYPMEAPGDEPEIDEVHHKSLVDFMLYRAYSTKDSEAMDDARAAQALHRFTENFGERPTANVMRKHREMRRVTTRPVAL